MPDLGHKKGPPGEEVRRADFKATREEVRRRYLGIGEEVDPSTSLIYEPQIISAIKKIAWKPCKIGRVTCRVG